jgi:glycosyltransferase involved in cell wall biosynthesis
MLAKQGFSIYTIYHVDVVDYFTRIYLHGQLRPERATRGYEWIHQTPLRHLVPGVLGLVFEKQRASVLYSKGLIVPSEGMRDVLKDCYPQIDPAKIHVIPWGIWPVAVDRAAVEEEKKKLREIYRLSDTSFHLLTLSRISPEKGQDRLLKALAHWERQSSFPSEGVTLLLAGEAAYMMGKRFEKKLHQLASRLKKARVIFTGYASGARKQALFELAQLYVFPSRHESYGLTLLEAMQAGLPSLACDDHGSRSVMTAEVGELLSEAPESKIPELLSQALQRLQSNPEGLERKGDAAKRYAGHQPFAKAAEQVAQLLLT